MITSASLHTHEIDNPVKALEEIQAQLGAKLALKKNSVGILHCGADFVESGVVSYLGKNLPFPIVGATTTSQAANDVFGSLILTILVMTSDDAVFLPTRTVGLAADLAGSIERSVPDPQRIPALPLKLVLVYPPVIEAYSGDSYVSILESLYGEVPVFGSLSVEEEIMTYARNATFYNDECLVDEMSYLLIYGDVTPQFFISHLQQTYNLLPAGTITKADGNMLHEIEGVPALDFFESIGFLKNRDTLSGVAFVPLVLSLQDKNTGKSSRFVRGLVSFDEKGSALCRGTIYENAVLTIGSNSADDIIAASRNTIHLLNQTENYRTVLIYSCVVRRTVLISNPLIELETVRNTICKDIPFMMAYAGGEICPTNYAAGDGVTNRFHNFSLIACAF